MVVGGHDLRGMYRGLEGAGFCLVAVRAGD